MPAGVLFLSGSILCGWPLYRGDVGLPDESVLGGRYIEVIVGLPDKGVLGGRYIEEAGISRLPSYRGGHYLEEAVILRWSLLKG